MLGPVDWRYLSAQKLGASVLLQFWRPRRVLLQFWRRRRFFFNQFLAPKALFIIIFGAEDAFYCQRRFVKTLCIVL